MMRENDGLDGARRNLRLYPLYLGGVSFFAWMPVFFLYFSSRLGLSDVLLLEAIYYGCVVLFEVPSGYFSDRFGRRATLIIAAACLVGSYASFILSSSFMGLAFGQALLALGLAFNSGTDTSFHLCNLEALGREAQYVKREARLSSLMFITNSVAALVGGAVALFDMRLAYVLSLAGALFALWAAASFQQLHVELDEVPASFMVSLRRCAALAWSPRLGWFFAAAVVATITNHIPYEFYQPYLERLVRVPWGPDTTPWIAGLHLSLVQFVAAPVAASSSWVSRRFGLVPAILGSMLLQALLIASMTYWISPWVALLLVGRSIPGALQNAPMRAAVAPYVPSELRATYLSLQSMVGRLGFSLWLVAVSLTTYAFTRVLDVAMYTSMALVVLLALAAWSARAKRALTSID